MQHTTNYNLKKPEGTDNIAISDLNGNADTIDAALKAASDAAASKYTKPSVGIPESDLSSVVRSKLNAGGTTFIRCETPFFIQGATLSNFTIDGVAATENEAGAAIFETDNIVIYVTETNVDGAGTHGLQVLRLNDKYGDTISFANYGYSGNMFLIAVDKIDETTFSFDTIVQSV